MLPDPMLQRQGSDASLNCRLHVQQVSLRQERQIFSFTPRPDSGICWAAGQLWTHRSQLQTVHCHFAGFLDIFSLRVKDEAAFADAAHL